MSRYLIPFVVAVCFCGLFIASFGEVLSGGRQFGYRDAGHFYYPLYERVQQEWEAGRVPLWEPEENGGMPLLGNPTAAVLYPGKLVYAVLRYPSAARWYIILHVVLAAVTMFGLTRSWGVSTVGSSIAAFSYAFGTPVLFQYCNIIFLVGAAWTPLGIFAADRWVRLGSRWGLVVLAVVLAMQTLGGDPQAAYLLGLCAAGYALGLAVYRGSGRHLFTWRTTFLAVVALALWIALTLLAARLFPRWMKAEGMFP